MPESNPAAAVEPNVEINGVRLRKLRKLAGHNLVTFAPLVDITVQYLSQIERGDRRRVSPAVYSRICEALGIAKKELLGSPDSDTRGPEPTGPGRGTRTTIGPSSPTHPAGPASPTSPKHADRTRASA